MENDSLDFENNLIPLEYDIRMNQIKISYMPLVEGQHVISILWHGEHVSDSPYAVTIESASEGRRTKQLKSSIKSSNLFPNPRNKERRKGTVKFQEPLEKIERIGKVINRRIVRHIVTINGKDVVVDADDIDHLATALLKLEYNCQTDPSKNRRNSWGFTGDAERKVSVIRQFCIPPHEMEAQQMKLLRRCGSLTINSISKRSLKRWNSFDNEDIQQVRLETVSENFDYPNNSGGKEELNEDAFAEIDEEFENSNISEECLIEQKCEELETSKITEACQTEHEDKSSSDREEDLDKEICHSLSDLNDSNNFVREDEFESILKISEDLIKDVSQPLSKLNFENKCIHQSLLETGFNKAESINLNVANKELSPNNLTRASETLVEEIVKNVTVCNVHVKENFEKSNINEILHQQQIVQCKNINSEENVLSNYSSISFVKNKFKDIYEEIKNLQDSKLTDPKALSTDCNCKFSHLENHSKIDGRGCALKLNEDSRSNLKKSKSKTPKLYKFLNKYKYSKKYLPYIFENQRFCSNCKKLMLNLYHSKICDFIIQRRRKNISSIYKNSKYNFTLKQQCRNINSVDFNLIHHKCHSNYIEPHPHKSFQFESERQNFHHIANSEEFEKTKPLTKKWIMINDMQKHKQKTYKDRSDFLSNKCNNAVTSNSFNSQMTTAYTSASSPQEHLLRSCYKNPTVEYQVRECNLGSLEQYNFKEFNPLSEKKKGSLIENKMKKLEKAVVKDSRKTTSNITARSTSENIDIKSKVTFWENVYKTDKQSQHEVISKSKRINRKHVDQDNTFIDDIKDNNDLKSKITEVIPCKPSEDNLRYTIESFDRDLSFNNENCNTILIKDTEDKLSANFKSSPKSKRSFSDPGVLESGIQDHILSLDYRVTTDDNFNQVSSTDNLSSSFDCLESSIDDALSLPDTIRSTEDEYIDDEIPDNSLFNYWGDHSLMKNLKRVDQTDYEQYMNLEILKNQLQTYPEQCKVFGIGIYYGYVAVKNRFQVLTNGAGPGNLSVSVEGFGKHDVGYVSVKYMHKDIYEVTYQVMRPGLYLIYLRWMEKSIAGSPFLCKITF